MQINKKIFKNKNAIAVDDYFQRVMYDDRFGYYFRKNPLGSRGDFITSPLISILFCEMIAVWLINTWENIGKPKVFNIVELGPGDGTLASSILKTFKNFPEFNKSINFFLYEKSPYLKNLQRKYINYKNVYWLNNFSKIRNGPVFFLGNEFFDAFPVKQFIKEKKILLEKHYQFVNNKIIETNKSVKEKDKAKIRGFKCLKKNKFFEYPKLGLKELERICKKIQINRGGILLIDYGYTRPIKRSTIQSVKSHRLNNIFENIGNADITAHVNFSLLREFFSKKKFKVKNLVSQSFFLKKLGIFERANHLGDTMNFKEKSDLYYRVKRLTDKNQMGNLFKVFFAHNMPSNKFIGFN